MITQVCYQRTGKVPVKLQNENLYNNQKYLIAFLKLGFIPEGNLIKNINRIKPEDLQSIIFDLAEMVGFDRGWEKTLFPDFPRYVTETPEEELRFHTFIHYLTTYGKEFLENLLGVEIKTYFPNAELYKEERQITLEDIEKLDISQTLVNKKYIDVQEEEECIKETFFSILYTNTPVMNDEMEFIKRFVDKFIDNIDLNKVKFKEVKNILLLNDEVLERIENIYPEDCFRYFVSATVGQNQLLLSSKLKRELKALNSNNYEDEIYTFWKLLSKCKREDIIKFYNQKRKLCNLVFSIAGIKRAKGTNIFRDIATFCKTLKNGNMKRNRKINKSDYGQLKHLIYTKSSIDELLQFLKSKPHLFVSEFNFIYTALYYQNSGDIITLVFNEVKDGINNKLLIRLYNNLNMNFRGTGGLYNVIYILPNRKTYLKENKKNNVDYNYLSNVELLKSFILDEIIQRLKNKIGNKKIVLNTANIDLGCKIPLATRGKDFEFENGSVLYLDKNTGYLRTGIYWKGNYVDLDLSAIFITKNYKIEIINWRDKYKNSYAVFSGDVTSAPNGAAEFIDINIEKAIQNNIRYAIVSNYMYKNNGLKEFFCGVQCRNDSITSIDKEKSKELFNPQNVRFAINKDIPDGADSIVLFMLDFKERALYPLNVPNNNGVIVAGHDTETIRGYIENIKYRWQYKLSYEDLLSPFAVNTVSKTDNVIEIKDNIQLQKFVRDVLEL